MLVLSHATAQQVCQLEKILILRYFFLCHYLCCTYILVVMLTQYAAEGYSLSLLVLHMHIVCVAKIVCRAVQVGCFRAVHGRLAPHVQHMAAC